jgi:hypothetical protein
MTTSVFRSEKITPFFIVQFCLVLIAISAVVLRPGGWNGARIVGLCIAVGRCLALYRALAVGKIVSCVSAGAGTCNLGPVFEDQEPDLRVQRVAASGRSDCLAISLRTSPPAGAGSHSDHSRPSRGKGSRSQVRRGIQELQKGNLVLAGCIIISREP